MNNKGDLVGQLTRPTSASLHPLVQVLWVVRVVVQAVPSVRDYKLVLSSKIICETPPCRECDILRFTALRNSCPIVAKRLCAGNLKRCNDINMKIARLAVARQADSKLHTSDGT